VEITGMSAAEVHSRDGDGCRATTSIVEKKPFDCAGRTHSLSGKCAGGYGRYQAATQRQYKRISGCLREIEAVGCIVSRGIPA